MLYRKADRGTLAPSSRCACGANWVGERWVPAIGSGQTQRYVTAGRFVRGQQKKLPHRKVDGGTLAPSSRCACGANWVGERWAPAIGSGLTQRYVTAWR